MAHYSGQAKAEILRRYGWEDQSTWKQPGVWRHKDRPGEYISAYARMGWFHISESKEGAVASGDSAKDLADYLETLEAATQEILHG